MTLSLVEDLEQQVQFFKTTQFESLVVLQDKYRRLHGLLNAQLSIAPESDLIMVKFLQGDLDRQFTEHKTKLESGQIEAQRKKLQGQQQDNHNANIVTIMNDVNSVLKQENSRVEDLLSELKHSTNVLRTIGLSSDKISEHAQVGRVQVGQIKMIEYKDRILVVSLFTIFVISSVFIVLRRFYKAGLGILCVFKFWKWGAVVKATKLTKAK